MGIYKVYSGKLGRDMSKYPKDVLKAYRAWDNIFSRCYVKTNRSFKTYGSVGIKMEFSRKELIGWYLEEIKKFKGENPCIGRKDHSKNYSLNNIEIQSISENSKERIIRLGTPFKSKPVSAISTKNGKLIKTFLSCKAAALYYKISKSTVHRQLKGDSISSKYFTFIYTGV